VANFNKCLFQGPFWGGLGHFRLIFHPYMTFSG
jgi:hypothetical protein